MPPVAGSAESLTLCLTAVTLGSLHTLLGPDHYLPFVAMARAGDWSLGRTLRTTVACGIAHVTGSVLIGAAGLVLGVAVMRLEAFEAWRGDLAAWLMIGFGLAYMTWGVLQASRCGRSPHGHRHADAVQQAPGLPACADDTPHTHPHRHAPAQLHVHDVATPVWSPWLAFLVFAFGPCEPLIPLLMYPASQAHWWLVVAVTAAFTLATLTTMAVAVVVLRGGARLVPAAALQRHAHALAGAAILGCGILITLGL